MKSKDRNFLEVFDNLCQMISHPDCTHISPRCPGTGMQVEQPWWFHVMPFKSIPSALIYSVLGMLLGSWDNSHEQQQSFLSSRHSVPVGRWAKINKYIHSILLVKPLVLWRKKSSITACWLMLFKNFIFIYFLAVPQGILDLSSLTREGLNLCSQQWKCGFLTTGLPGKSQADVALDWIYLV